MVNLQKFVIAIAVLLTASNASAQLLSPYAAVGVAIPAGPLGQYRDPGPVVQLGILLGDSLKAVRFRFALEGLVLPGTKDPQNVSSSKGRLRAGGLSAGLQFGPRRLRIAPYGYAGLTAHRVAIRGAYVASQNALGMRGGLGVRARTGVGTFSVEMTPHIMFTDYGTGRDFQLGQYYPLMFGFSF